MKISCIWRKIYRNGPMAFVLMLMAATLFFCSLPSSVQAEEIFTADTNLKTAPCPGLKPLESIDDLLYQFHANLESDCLFKMSDEELEDAWGIKILSRKRAKSISEFIQLRDSSEFANKPYKSPKDAFYVEITRHSEAYRDGAYRYDDFNPELIYYFDVCPTNEYHEKYGYFYTAFDLSQMFPDMESRSKSSLYSFQWYSSYYIRYIIFSGWNRVHRIMFYRPHVIYRPQVTTHDKNAE